MNRMKGLYVVYAYECIKATCDQSGQKLTAPHVDIILKKISDDNSLSSSYIIPVKSNFLPLLKIGTVIEDGKCIGYSKNLTLIKTSLIQKLGSWRYSTQNDYIDLFKSSYPLRKQDQSSFIEFTSVDGYKVLIPCLSYFSACYGFSAELKRILLTYHWDEVRRRICGPIDVKIPANKLIVNIPKNLVDDDATFIAHAMYDSVAQRAAKYLYSQIQTNYTDKKNAPLFLQVAPWFTDSIEVELRGLWLAKDVFLGLAFEGVSEPDGENILYNRANRSSNSGEGNKPDSAWKNTLKPKVNLPLVVLNSNYDPAPDEPPIEVIEPRLKVIGHRRAKQKIDLGESATSSGSRSPKSGSNIGSSGDRQPGNKGISPVKQTPNIEEVAGGTLLEMWRAALTLQIRHPDIFKNVRCYLMENNYIRETEPLLISLDPYTEEEKSKLSEEEKRWIYSNYSKRKIRGILVIQIDLSNISLVIVELERKHGAASREEKVKGFIFEKNGQLDFDTIINKLKKRLRDEFGNMNKCIAMFKNASTFNHPSSPSHEIKCQRAIINAFSKIGVEMDVIRTMKKGIA